MPYRTISLIGLILLLTLGTNKAYGTPESRAAVLFLLIEPGTRANGMGDAFTAIANDATATYFNPAGLSQLRYGAVHNHNKTWLPGLADDLTFEHRSIAVNTQNWGVIGISQTILDLGTQVRTGERGNIEGYFESKDEAITISYAQDLSYLFESMDLSLGVNWKKINSKLADPEFGGGGDASAVDVGILMRNILPVLTYTKKISNLPPWLSTRRSNTTTNIYDVVYLKDGKNIKGVIIEEKPAKSISIQSNDGSLFVFELTQIEKIERKKREQITTEPLTGEYISHRTSRGLSIGLGISNVGGDIVYGDITQADPLPRNLRIGISYTPIDTDLIGGLVAFDLYKPIIPGTRNRNNNGSRIEDYHFGLELTFAHLFSYRYGWHSDEDGEIEGTTWGIGIGPETLRLNYSKRRTEATPFGNQSSWAISAAF